MKIPKFTWFVLCVIVLNTFTPRAVAQDIPTNDALIVAGFHPNLVTRVDEIVSEAIGEQKMPGCVVCFGRRDHVAFLRAYGQRQVQPQPEPMTVDTVFDLASLTKPIATATSVMQLCERGQLRLGQKVAEILPEFGINGKEAITIEQLLTHQSGLIPDNALADYEHGPEESWRRICQLGLAAPVGQEFKYSDVNFIVLGEIVRRITGLDLGTYTRQSLFGPLGMHETGFLPQPELFPRMAPTEQRAGQWIRGQVHDPRAFLLGGVAGHAGLFSTASDLSIYARTMLQMGKGATLNPKTILSAAAVQRMTRRYPVSSGWRGLGWDKQTGYSTNKGDLLSDAAYGHGGFTGTVLWIDPQQDLFFIFLSNRVHPNGKGNVNSVAGQIANVISSAQLHSRLPAGFRDGIQFQPTLTSKAATRTEVQIQGVTTGLEVLLRDRLESIAKQRVGLITNSTGVDSKGASATQLLFENPAVRLTAIFSPEHGIAAKLDQANIDDGVDAATGVKIFSLYGKTRRPTADMLAEVDVLVFDIQDIGTRFYTYISTMGEAMHAAAEHGKKFVVLDRPNPLGGMIVEGPLLDTGSESFVGFHPLPLRHGMTVGELALMLRDELDLKLDLQVIPCENWDRADYWDGTGLVWVNPSPNMRCLNQAVLYPGVGVWEMTNLSVGRGTETPFEVLGAPWIDGKTLARELSAASLAGVRFVPIRFTPNSSKYAGQVCGGVNIIVVDRSAFRSVELGLAIAVALKKLYSESWDVKEINRLLGNKVLADAIRDGKDLEQLRTLSNNGVAEFMTRRQRFLLY
ncbi:MAG: DUF1343 domain-containing protein [Planctomycetaceae bacterium]|nr:DUF1343 domain-containing protein [Planctomycetaceae bacterium]